MKLFYKISAVAKGRPRFRMLPGRNYPMVYTDTVTATYETAIKMLTKSQLNKYFVPFDGAISVSINIEITRPKSVTRDYPSVKPDLDNYAKAILDSLNGIIWHDDAQICSLQITKSYNLKPTITVEIEHHKGELNVIPARGTR